MSERATGGLKVQAFGTGYGTPVGGARVTLRPYRGDSVLETLITDDAGQGDEVELDCPPLAYSQESGAPKPYAEYDVTVEADGYLPTAVRGVQVLPDCTALQEVFLQTQGAGEEVIDVQPNTLWGNYPPKIPETDTKPLPPSKGYVLLANPVVPETIVVHAGAPTASAPNYRVPFADYIKNVASCEIYATWPDAAIRANVLAIISFTLNRVYTEWYRGKGYSFTITNSTAYDHAFTYGRNIFENISAIVDEMFTTFITKPDIRQPLFTQYCDGKKVSCPNWMTQWGSKTLGDRGYSAVNILKHYYGQDIYLMQATQVEGVPASFPGYNLQNGSRGEAVRTIQAQLNSIANHYPAIPKVREDGIFGGATLAAVEKFQSIFGLSASGIVDFSTWYKLSHIYVAVNRIAELR
jgi:peptidoglycan hydrolase-like protein with peptidoglycan-binding domain